jgi:hypothetical protein
MQVLQIRLMENVRVDHDRLGALYSQLGEAGAEDVVCRALEELALRLSQCEVMFRENAWAELRKTTRTLVAIADQIGMSALSRVAGDVTVCIDRGDFVSIAATLSRLLRVGERSLTAVWDIREMPI